MSFGLFLRLSLMVFLHYFVWGAWYVTMSTYLSSTLKFPGNQIGLCYGTTAIGAMVSPFIAGVLADRYFSTERFLAVLHLLGAALLWWISTQSTFAMFYPLLIVYTITYMAGHGLTNSMTLHHSANPAREFPLVMLSASLGWICSGLAISGFKLEDSAGAFRLASGAALCMGVYSLTLPHTPPKGGAGSSWRSIVGIDALGLLKNRSFAVFMICSFLVCIPLSFYFAWMNAFMNELKIENAAAKMTIGQVSDVVFLLLLPLLSPRLGAKGILVIGMAAWALRFGLFAVFATQTSELWMLYLGIALHGMCYDFIFVMGRMYVDRRATPEIRGAAQGLHALVTLGAGMFIGSWLAGEVGERYATTVAGIKIHDWRAIWVIPAALSALLVVIFAALFNDKESAVAHSDDESDLEANGNM